ncbi:hypothetical protein HaloA020_29070 [Halomonas sp. A020]|uniref:hypothetical protein n=1 Tax=Halomonas sp. A020 TaxID=2717374 RepID=UPI002492DFC0|nr:hypothetical protein [Halomonas sp. A020]BCB62206.1 hypothetical protein HaloA020_29070 [Halomonas sp. A020]
MRYISARQMIFDAYHTRRGNSPIADLFDNLKRIRERVGDNGAKLRSLMAEHKRNVKALSNAGPFDANLNVLKRAVANSERRLSEMRTALEDVSKSSNEGISPDNDWRIVNGLEAGQVISAVENQPQHLQALARYCFGPFTRDELAEDREWIHAALMHVGMQMRLPGQGQAERPSAEAARQLRWIVSAAIHHHAETTYPYNRPGLHNPRRIAAWIELEHGEVVDVRRWAASGRTCWKGVWERLLDTLDRWECAALAPVAGLLVKAA